MQVKSFTSQLYFIILTQFFPAVNPQAKKSDFVKDFTKEKDFGTIDNFYPTRRKNC